MLTFVVLVLVAYIIYLHAKIVRGGLAQAETPIFVDEEPPMSKALKATADRLDRWRAEGRLSAAEHEKLKHLAREDAAREAPKAG